MKTLTRTKLWFVLFVVVVFGSGLGTAFSSPASGRAALGADVTVRRDRHPRPQTRRRVWRATSA